MIKRLLAFALAAGSLAFAGEYWNVDPGGTTMKFLSMHVSPRTAAMSGAGVADVARASEVSRNPLAMSTAEIPEFGINQIIMDGAALDKFTSAYFAFPVAKSFAAAATVDFLGYDEIEGRDEEGMKAPTPGAFRPVSVAVTACSTGRAVSALLRKRLTMRRRSPSWGTWADRSA